MNLNQVFFLRLITQHTNQSAKRELIWTTMAIKLMVHLKDHQIKNQTGDFFLLPTIGWILQTPGNRAPKIFLGTKAQEPTWSKESWEQTATVMDSEAVPWMPALMTTNSSRQTTYQPLPNLPKRRSNVSFLLISSMIKLLGVSKLESLIILSKEKSLTSISADSLLRAMN